MAFVNPAAWLFGALFGVLIALYFWERARRHADVPSLLLWQAIPEAVVRTARFRPDWLFVVQCLLLAALIGGLADPYLTAGVQSAAGRRVVLILDLSASMQAREGRETRLDLARAALRARIAALGPDDEIMLIGAANHPVVAAPFTRDHGDVVRRLAALEPVDARANLDAALSIATTAAAQPDHPAEIELVTDAPPGHVAPQWRDRIALVPVGETDDNLAIEALQISQGRFEDYRDAHGYVSIRNFAHREAHGMLTLQLDDTILSRRGFTVAARSTVGFPLQDFPAAGVLRASIDTDDALAADNVAYAEVRPARQVRVLAVTNSPVLQGALHRIAAATPNLSIDVVPPDAYAGAAGADIVLFHRFAPPFPPDAASLYVAPEGDASPFTVRRTFPALTILDWNAHHDVLAGLRPEVPFGFGPVRELDVPPWAEPLMTARADGHEVPLALAGEHDGYRRAALAFDIAEESLLSADHDNVLLVFLNLLEWLAPVHDGVRIMRTGDVEVVDHLSLGPHSVVDPRQRESALGSGTSVSLDAAYAGEYRIDPSGAPVRVFANLSDAEESDIGRAGQGATAPKPLAPAPVQHPQRGLASEIYAAAAGLMLIEWLAARRQWA